MRKWISLAAVGLSALSMASPKRIALVVGVNGYSFDKAKPAFNKLRSASNDMGWLRLLLGQLSFDVKQISETNATREKIMAALKELAGKATDGDQVLFYFTGRGSIDSKGAGGKNLQPTLVPFDGAADTSDNDVKMSDLEAWADTIKRKNATPVILLDASYSTGITGSRENRFYQNSPKCQPRKGSPRADLWKGPGLCLSATDTTGNAFEWRVDFASDKWRSPFTENFVAQALLQLRKATPRYSDLMRVIHLAWRRDPTYMPKTRPVPSMEALQGDYDAPIFGLGESDPPPEPAPEVKPVIREIERVQRQFRVTIEADDNVANPGRRAALLKKYAERVAALLKTSFAEVVIVPEGGALPDRRIYIDEDQRQFVARVIGDEVTRAEGAGTQNGAILARQFKAKTPEELFKQGGFPAYLERMWLTEKLWSFMDLNRPTGSLRLRAKATMESDDVVRLLVQGDGPGSMLLLDQDEADGVANLVWPNERMGEISFEGNWSKRLGILPESPTGITRNRAIVIRGVELPAVEKGAGFDKSAAALLRVVWDALNAKGTVWDWSEAKYEHKRTP